jgi:hypothetical protein
MRCIVRLYMVVVHFEVEFTILTICIVDNKPSLNSTDILIDPKFNS